MHHPVSLAIILVVVGVLWLLAMLASGMYREDRGWIAPPAFILACSLVLAIWPNLYNDIGIISTVVALVFTIILGLRAFFH